MSDESNPRSLAFQLNIWRILYGKLPRHRTRICTQMKRASEFVEELDLESLELPLPGTASRRHRKRPDLTNWLSELEKSAATLVESTCRIDTLATPAPFRLR